MAGGRRGGRFSTLSLARLNTCHPDLVLLFTTVVVLRDCSIMCGRREQADQDAAFEAGKSKLRWPNSKHNSKQPGGLSLAVDVAPYFSHNRPQIVWPNRRDTYQRFAQDSGLWYEFAGYVWAVSDRLGLAERLRWGGDWYGDGLFFQQSFDDLPHWELMP